MVSRGEESLLRSIAGRAILGGRPVPGAAAQKLQLECGAISSPHLIDICQLRTSDVNCLSREHLVERQANFVSNGVKFLPRPRTVKYWSRAGKS